MGGALREVLALMGDQRVTLAAFGGLLAYSLILLASADAWSGRVSALLLLCSTLTWFVLVLAGRLQGDLANWSPLAVLLLAIGREGRFAGPRLGNAQDPAPAHPTPRTIGEASPGSTPS